MSDIYPSIDTRRAKRFAAELKQLVDVFVPALQDSAAKDNVGNAVIEIAARLAGEVTQRLDKVPRRDKVAFFQTLDVPQEAPRTSRVSLIFTLNEKRDGSVFIPALVQAAADGKDGEEVIFETKSEQDLTPARLSYAAAVITEQDYIEEPPPQFFQLASLENEITYQLVTSSPKGSHFLQLSPALGLEKGDIITIAGSFYRVEEFKNGLTTLVEGEPLEQDINSGAEIKKITRFDVFKLRNLQKHIVYIGHVEAFNLERPSTIHLAVEPPSAVSSLANLNLTFEWYGISKEDKKKEAGWHKFDERDGDIIRRVNGEIVLYTEKFDSVDEFKVNGNKSRWLKITLDPQDSDVPVSTDFRISNLNLRVESGEGEVQQISTINSNCCFDDEQPSNAVHPSEPYIDCKLIQSEGSKTVKQAFHNATPLPLTTRFFPFGMEPLRFDTFALAAPEALSKKGAKATLTINLVDATPAKFELALSDSKGARHVYAIGFNGRLQIIELSNGGKFGPWRELEYPRQLPQLSGGRVGSDDIKLLQLDTNLPPQAAKVDGGDLVVVWDKGGRLWLTKVSKKETSFDKTDWQFIPPPDPESLRINDIVLYPPQGQATDAYLFTVTDSGLYLLKVRVSGVPVIVLGNQGRYWEEILPKVDASKPVFGSDPDKGIRTRLISILSPQWPAPPAGQLGVVVLDAMGVFWRGTYDLVTRRMDWNKLIAPPEEEEFPPGNSKVRPIAASFGNDGKDFVIFAAAKESIALFSIRIQDSAVKRDPKPFLGPQPRSQFIVQAGTELRCVPSYRVNDGSLPIVLALGHEQGQKENKSPRFAFWWDDDFKVFDYPSGIVPGGVSSGVFFPQPDSPPFVLISGGRETLYMTQAVDPSIAIKAYTLHDSIKIPESSAAHYLEIIDNDTRTVVKLRDILAIANTHERIYTLRTERLSSGQKYSVYKRLSDGASFRGTVVPEVASSEVETLSGERVDSPISSRLRLDPNDGVNYDKLPMIKIGRHIYRVKNFDTKNRIATLKDFSKAVGKRVSYLPLLELINAKAVEDQQIGTLFEVTDDIDRPSTPITKIRFNGRANPKIQAVLAYSFRSGAIWALLKSPWAAIPDGQGATLYVQPDIVEWSAKSFQSTEKNPELSWEYFNGEGWRRLEQDFNDTTNNLAVSGRICFRVPHDIEATEISGKKDFWIRARLVGGDYGRAKYVVATATTPPDSEKPAETTQTISIDTSEVRAPEILAMDACFQMDNPLSPEFILTENNGDALDQTQANIVEAATFALFEGVSAIDSKFSGSRALYLGFTKSYHVNPLSLYINADEPEQIENLTQPITLEFEILTQGGRWSKVTADDRTFGFQRRGLVKLFVNVEPQRSRLFGKELFWLRMHPAKKDTEWKPLLKGIYINAVEAEHARSFNQEILGSSSGEPKQSFFVSKPPVIAKSLELRVREALSEDERLELEQAKVAISLLDEVLGNSDRIDLPIVAAYPDISDEWVLWREVASFVDYDGDARVYQLDPSTGEVRFGDGKQGKIPPAGRDSVRAIKYQNGGGEVGNVEAFAIKSLKSSVESVDSVINPIAATGGVDAPSVDVQIQTAPKRLRHRQQAITPLDIEALTLSFSSEIGQARCLTPKEPNDKIQVFISRQTGERCPKASLAEREALRSYLLGQSWGALDENFITISNPDYVPVKLDVSIIARSSDTVSVVEKEAKERLLKYLHPITGGRDGTGWPFGQMLWKSSLFQILMEITALDRIEKIKLMDDDLEKLVISPSSVICVENDNDIEVTVKIDKGGN